MILHVWTVDEAVNRSERARFTKSLHVADGSVPIALVRTRAGGVERGLGAVLLVHGYGQNRYAWHLPLRSPANYLAQAGFDVFALDLRGHGRSRDLGAPRAEDVHEHVREDIPQAMAEIGQVRGEQGAFLIGHSLGGLLVYAAAPLLGDQVRGVVSMGSPYYFAAGQRGLSLMGDVLLWLDGWLGFGRGGLTLYAVAEAVRLGRRALESRWLPLPFRGYHPGSIERDVLGQHLTRAMDIANLPIMRGLFRAGIRQRSIATIGGLDDYAAAFEAMDRPLLVVAGRLDDLAPPASVRPAYERSRARDKTYRVVEHGHVDMLVGREAPNTTWPLLHAWLRKRSDR